MCVFFCRSNAFNALDFNLLYSLGFQDVVTIDMLREAYPVLDVVDHNRRPKDSVSTNVIEICCLCCCYQ